MTDPTPLSLLERLSQQPFDDSSWRRFVDLYTVWLESWLGRLAHLPPGHPDSADILQSVFAVVCRKMASFQHNGRPGAFRAWLRSILVNCLREHQKRQQRAAAVDLAPLLDQLADPDSELSRQWDREHHAHVVQRLLERGRQHFTPYAWEVFRRTVLAEEPAARVATDLGVSVNAILVAKARVLRWLRSEAEDLLE
jgi:RNA polymerase sigma factor (sigma-70 family)